MQRLLAGGALLALVAAAVSLDRADAKDILWTEKKRYSIGDEELVIRDFFQDRRDGFFVDVGCAHPRKGSNTYYLERRLGWSGVGVDGLPGYAESWRRLRPRSAFFNFLVTNHSDTIETFYRSALWGLSTARKDVAARRSATEIRVPSITLDDLLVRSGVERIDLLSIDVEGFHEEVLAGFDVERWKPELVCIEEEGWFAIPWFRAHGYEPIERYRDRDIVNWYFAPKDRAAAANARRTEAGEQAMRERRVRLAKEPPASPLRHWYEPRVVLGPGGAPMARPVAAKNEGATER